MRLFWSRRFSRLTAVTALCLVMVAIALGSLGWHRPEPSRNLWLVTNVPVSLWLLLVTFSVVCVGAAAALTLTNAVVRWTGPTRAAWVMVVLAATAALGWNALFLASQAAPGPQPIIPVFDWAFVAIPAILGGILALRHGATASLTAALGTAVVTLPLYALGSTLLRTDSTMAAALLREIQNTTIFGILPLTGALVLINALAGPVRPREPTAPAPDR